VALFGNIVVVGADKADVNGNNDQGAAYVFIRSGKNWTQQTKLIASDSMPGNWFGKSVALYEGTVVVGASGADIAGYEEQGTAYVFTQSNGNWIQQTKVTASDSAAGDRFGVAVAISGDAVAIGAYQADVGTILEAGMAYIYVRVPNPTIYLPVIIR
jgi:hypothetical protein